MTTNQDANSAHPAEVCGSTKPRRRDRAPLGPTQVLVLRLLADNRPKSARGLAYDWPGLSEGAARSALLRLGRRGLVDPAGWEDHGTARTYCLTDKGAAVVATAVRDTTPANPDDSRA